MPQDELEFLSDSELQRNLIDCGFPNVPVTETTRKILINKLRNFMKNKKNADHLMDQNVSKRRLGTGTNKIILNKPSFVEANHYNLLKRDVAESQINKLFVEIPNTRVSNSFESYSRMDKRTVFNDLNSPNGSSNVNVVNKLLRLRERTIGHIQCSKVANLEEIVNSNYKKGFNDEHNMFGLMKWTRHLRNIFGKNGLKQSIIPYILMLLLIIFLLTISIIYLNQIPSSTQPLTDRNVEFDLCFGNYESENCIKQELYDKAIEISQSLLSILSENSKNFVCTEQNLLPTISLNDLLHKFSFSDLELKATIYVIKKNPQWNILIEPFSETFTELTDVTNLTSFKSAINFKLLNKKLKIKCSLSRKLHRFFLTIGCLSLVGAISFITINIVKCIRNYKLNQKEMVYEIVKEIMNALLLSASNQNSSGKCELILNHLRDQIVPLKNRKVMLKFWENAVKFLEQNDSRVSFGTTIKNGETCKTIKWNSCSGDTSNTFNKKWNSPAFDNTNRIIDPPTPCLKIRHMFDKTEINTPNLKEALYKAIVEKVGQNCRIRDFQIDLQTCCVYIRCESEKDAGLVHKEINGWWFDKRLVSIKFLHLERYLLRFPNEINTKIKM